MSNLLVVLAELTGKPKWMSVESTLHKHLPTLSHTLVYTEQGGEFKEKADNRIMLLCSCSVDPLVLSVAISGICQDLAGVCTTTPEFRLYIPYMAPLGISTLSPEQTEDLLPSHVMVSVALTPLPSADSSFNDWYHHEHIPLLQQVPTWVSSERFTLQFSTNEDIPSYLAIHRWNNKDPFGTKEYRAATNTSWRTAVMSKIVKKERSVLKYEGKLVSLAQEML